MESDNGQETVFWVNRFSERSVRKVLEDLRILKPSKQEAFSVIRVEEIDELQDEELRDSLKRQLRDIREKAWTIELPVAHMPDKRFSHSYGVLTKSSADQIHERIGSAGLNDFVE